MKKVLILFSVLVFSFALLTGCAEDNTTEPSNRPYSMSANEYIDNFTDGDLITEQGIIWTVENDSENSGTSTVDTPKLVATGLPNGMAMGVTMTVKATMLVNTNKYTSLAIGPSYYGYVKVVANMPANGANLKANGNVSLSFDSLFSNTTGGQLFVVINGKNGGYVSSSGQSISTGWNTTTISLDSFSPSDIAYSVDDVVKNASSIEIVVRYISLGQGDTKTLGVYFDEIQLDNTI